MNGTSRLFLTLLVSYFSATLNAEVHPATANDHVVFLANNVNAATGSALLNLPLQFQWDSSQASIDPWVPSGLGLSYDRAPRVIVTSSGQLQLVLAGPYEVITFNSNGLPVVTENSEYQSLVAGNGGYTLYFNSDPRIYWQFNANGFLINKHQAQFVGAFPLGVLAPIDTRFFYDNLSAANKLTRIVDAFGNTTSFSYGNGGLLSSIVIPDGRIFSFNYDSNNNLISIKDPSASAILTMGYAGSFVTSYSDLVSSRTISYNTDRSVSSFVANIGGVIENISFSYPSASEFQTTDSTGTTTYNFVGTGASTLVKELITPASDILYGYNASNLMVSSTITDYTSNLTTNYTFTREPVRGFVSASYQDGVQLYAASFDSYGRKVQIWNAATATDPAMYINFHYPAPRSLYDSWSFGPATTCLSPTAFSGCSLKELYTYDLNGFVTNINANGVSLKINNNYLGQPVSMTSSAGSYQTYTYASSLPGYNGTLIGFSDSSTGLALIESINPPTITNGYNTSVTTTSNNSAVVPPASMTFGAGSTELPLNIPVPMGLYSGF